MLLDHVVQDTDNICITLRCILWSFIEGRPRQTDTTTTSLHREVVLDDEEINRFPLLWQPYSFF
jgi:hypothetical protein